MTHYVTLGLFTCQRLAHEGELSRLPMTMILPVCIVDPAPVQISKRREKPAPSARQIEVELKKSSWMRVVPNLGLAALGWVITAFCG